mmetsp:Transcript_10536/g.8780  ORF Transcript_10536/g.8780 Transcript_10536/m.8780 type:complete len:89 (+) Transcript_10536:958-1224(+)
MFEDTCDAWITTAMGAWSQDMFISTVYGTLGPDAVVQSIQESNATTIFCNRKNVGKLIARKSDTPTCTANSYICANGKYAKWVKCLGK